MTFPVDKEFIFEQQFRGHIWRVQLCEYQGRDKVSIWPWYKAKDGQLHPSNPDHIRNGLQMPPERLWALGDAITVAKAEIESSGA